MALRDALSIIESTGYFQPGKNSDLSKDPAYQEYRKKLEEERKRVIDQGLNQGMSWEDISTQSGIPLDQVQSYSEQNRPGYGVTPPKPTLVDRGKGVVEAVTSSYNRAGTSIGESLAYGSKDVTNARNAQQTTVDTNLEIIRKATAQLRDPNVPEEKKARLRRLVEVVGGSNQEILQQAAGEAQRVQEQLDPLKNAAAIANIGMDIATLGTVASAATGAKVGMKTGRLYTGRGLEKGTQSIARQALTGAGQGALAGTFGAVEQNGKDTNLKDLATGAVIGGALGGGFTGASGKLGQWISDRASAKAARLADAQTANLNAPIDRAANDLINELDAEAAFTKSQGITDPSRLLPDGSESKAARLAEIDAELDGLRKGTTDPNAYKSVNSELTALAGEPTGNPTLNKSGEVRNSPTTKAGTFANDTPKTVGDATSTAQRARELMKERQKLVNEIKEIKDPTNRVAEDIIMIENKIAKAEAKGNKTLVQKLNKQRDYLMGKAEKIDIQTKKTDPRAVQGRQFLQKQGNIKTNALQRTFLSTAGKLSRMGEAGKTIANKLHEIEFRQETLAGDWGNKLENVFKLKNKEFAQFVDALEKLNKGETPAVNSKINKAIKEWVDLSPQIRQTAIDAGWDVGDLGPYYFPKNYLNNLKKASGRQAAAEHLVKTGQSENIGEALQALDYLGRKSKINPYGHLTESRVIDLPDYDKSKRALAEYLHFTAKSIGEAEQLGPKNEIGQELIDAIGKEGYDAAAADRMLKVSLGQVRGSDVAENASRYIRRFNALRSLRTAAISNAGQTANTATVSGWTNTIKSVPKLFDKKTRQYVEQTGVTADAILNEIQQQYGFDRGITSFISAPIFKQVEKFNRSLAAISGEQWANSLAVKASKGNQKALAQLRKLGVTGDIAKELTLEQRIRASRGLVERTQFKISPKDLPEWTNSPGGKLVAQFRTFSYKQSKFMVDEIFKPMGEGNFAPMARFMAALPLGYAVSQTKNFARTKIEGGKDFTEDDEFVDNVKAAFEALGGGGLVSTATFAAEKFGQQSFDTAIAGAIGGPTAGYVYDLFKNTSDAAQGDVKPLARQLTKSVPLVGNTLSNKLLPYEKTVASELTNENVSNELNKASKETNYVPQPPNKKQDGNELSDEDYAKYKAEYYKKFESNLSILFSLPEYKKASNEDKKDLIQKVVRISGDQTREQMFGKQNNKTDNKNSNILKEAGISR